MVEPTHEVWVHGLLPLAGACVNETSLKALLEKAKAFGDMQKEEESYVVPNEELKEAYENLPQKEREALDRIHAR